MDPVDGDQVYAAEQLLKTRKRAGKTEYFVKWKGWGAKYNTWEPADNILDPRLIEDFEKRHPPRVATKRASEGTAPTTPVPKRGRISNRGAAKEETPESSSASTSASARAARNSRRSRRGESAASDVTTEEKIDEEPATETTEEADKKKEEAKVAADGKAEPEPEEKEEAKEEEDEKKAENEQPTKEVSEETQEEEKEKDEQPEQQEEAKDEELSMKLDESSTSAQETAAAAPDAPLEVYVEKTVNGERSEASEAAPAPVNGDASASGNGTEAFVITKEDDPACTHKIQVFRAPTEGTAAETSRDDSSDVEFVETIEKKETVIETVRTGGDNDSDDCVVLETTTTETTVTESVVGPTASTEQ